MSYLFLKYIHILSSTLLFGTGLGTAFHGFLAFRTKDPRVVAAVGRSVVLADWLFTAPAVVIQPITGVTMAVLASVPLTQGWLALSIALYVLVGVCWLPVVWLQIQLRRMARKASRAGIRCHRYITAICASGSCLAGLLSLPFLRFST